MFADLHLHTTASDGNLTPRQVVARAKEMDFCALAITDHDTVDGLNEAFRAGSELNVEVIGGIELSALENGREVHILGFFINHEHKKLKKMLGRFIDSREKRAGEIVKKLNNIGLEIELKRVMEISGGHFVGRPHIAEALKEKGYISEITEAFSSDFLGRGGKAYVERFELNPREAVELIKKAGGIAVLAHPGYQSDRLALDEEEIKAYKKLGVAGIEVYYSYHTLKQVYYYANLARKLDLFITGGSDCHGGKDSNFGCIRLPYSYVEVLKNEKFDPANDSS